MKRIYRLENGDKIQKGDICHASDGMIFPVSIQACGMAYEDYAVPAWRGWIERPIGPCAKHKRPKAGKWKRVEDELPDNSRDVIGQPKGHDRTRVVYYKPAQHIWGGTDGATITHWRELPSFKEGDE